MKKWTVMLVPHDRGITRTISISSFHIYLVLALIVSLSFTTSFLVQRHRSMMERQETLRDIARQMELRLADFANRAEDTPASATDDDTRAVEARLRAEYEQSLGQIHRQLSKLYELEVRARSFAGLAEEAPVLEDPQLASEDGRGGASVMWGPAEADAGTPQPRLPSMTFGSARPSADLILQETELRIAGFTGAVLELERHQDGLDRMPSIWPVSRNRARLTSGFGYRKDPFSMRVRHHAGIDLAAPTGTPVKAAAKGKVVESEYHKDYGNMVVLDHGNGLQTLYGHLSRRDVEVGATVQRSDIIGLVGSTGRSTGPHLHYEVHVNGKPVNARPYLD